MNAYTNAMRRYATFSGRSSRAEFLQAHAVLLPLMMVAFWVLGAPRMGRSIWPTLAFALIVVPHIVPWAALVVRRVHDTDRAGWWALASLIPLVVVPPLSLLALLGWGALRGTPGPNRYGPEPVRSNPMPSVPRATVDGPVPVQQRDIVEQIERLARLRASGALTDGEFEVMKAKALRQGTAP